jgi:hypothetical protein
MRLGGTRLAKTLPGEAPAGIATFTRRLPGSAKATRSPAVASSGTVSRSSTRTPRCDALAANGERSNELAAAADDGVTALLLP